MVTTGFHYFEYSLRISWGPPKRGLTLYFAGQSPLVTWDPGWFLGWDLCRVTICLRYPHHQNVQVTNINVPSFSQFMRKTSWHLPRCHVARASSVLLVHPWMRYSLVHHHLVIVSFPRFNQVGEIWWEFYLPRIRGFRHPSSFNDPVKLLRFFGGLEDSSKLERDSLGLCLKAL